MQQKYSQETGTVRTGLCSDTQYGAVVPPLYLSSNFTFKEFAEPRQYDYSRSGNPTRDALAEAITELEEGRGAAITSSGMAAINLVCQLLSPGDLVIVPHDCYGGSFRLFTQLAARGSFKVEFVDQNDFEALKSAFSRQPAMIWIETPSNPLLRIVDVAKIASLARNVGALTVVDNTFLSPALQQPLALGADLVVHSTTKYLNGHSDVVGGAVVCATDELAEQIKFWANCLGSTGAPFDSFLTLRGIRTLHARIRHHEENANAIARFLERDSRVKTVYYPGLESDPGHVLASRQQSGFGGMVSFEINGGHKNVKTFIENLRCFSLAESLGGVESLICHPSTMTHAPLSEVDKARAGINNRLIRLSVGIENADDLIGDIEQALARGVPQYQDSSAWLQSVGT